MAIKGNIFASLVAAFSNRHTSTDEKERIEAIMEVRYEQPLYTVENWSDDASDPIIYYRGYDMNAAQEALMNADRDSDVAHREQMVGLYETIAGEASGYLAAKKIPAINEESDSLCYEVQQHFGGKYTIKDLPNGDTVKLRIADHSGKSANNFGSNCISIVIADKNYTAHFRQQAGAIAEEYYFDSATSSKEIITFINKLLNSVTA